MTLERALVWMRALRVNQWTKNGVVFLAWFFAFADESQAALARGWRPLLLVTAMAASFGLLSSAFYLLNDVSDYYSDRLHPVKRFRPVAADLVSKIDAVRVALALFACSLSYPAFLVFRHPDRTLGFAVLLIYTVMQSFYSGVLKHVPYVDVAVIAVGFVLRAVAGAAVMNVRISPWLLVCTFALSMFLALCKRRHEKETACASRVALEGYHPVVLDVLIGISAAATLSVYAWYTLAADTVARFGSHALVATVPFVALGLARYYRLMYVGEDVGRPEKVLLTDRIMWIVIAGYSLSAISAVVIGRIV
jgi:4-hydroxybenzoate polyprenyltransferase